MDIRTQLLADRLAARPLETDGYVVIIEPPAAAIPEKFQGYRPNLLAIKGDEHIMVDVSGEQRDEAYYMRLHKLVEQSPGWSLMLASFQMAQLHDDGTSRHTDSNVDELRKRLRELAHSVSAPDFAIFVFPRLWLVFMAALRLQSRVVDAPVSQLSDLSCLNQAFALGPLSWEDFDTGRRMLDLRNDAVSDLNATITVDDCLQLKILIEKVLEQLVSLNKVAKVFET